MLLRIVILCCNAVSELVYKKNEKKKINKGKQKDFAWWHIY